MSIHATATEPMWIEFTIPIRTALGLNAREHWAVRAKRVKRERTAAWAATLHAFPSARSHSEFATGPLTITLTRISPGTRKADSDQVPGACKHARDGIADALGRDDGDEALDWRYAQERGPWGVRVRIEPKAGE